MQETFRIYGLASIDEPDRIRYIGLTKGCIHKRLVGHRSAAKRLKHHAACWIRSCGKNIIAVLIEDGISREEILDKEIFHIKKYRELGYELTNGTEGGIVYTNGNKVSQSKVGKKLTEAHRKSLSLSHIGYVPTDEQRRKIGNAHFNRPRIYVEQYDVNGVLIREWPSARIANREAGINYKHISACINGKRKTAGGFFWKRKEPKQQY